MPVRVYTVTVSDTLGPEDDLLGPQLQQGLEAAGFVVVRHLILRQEVDHIRDLVHSVSNDNLADAVVFAGGTGIAPRDVTPEALEGVFDKRLDGFGESFRRRSEAAIGPKAMLSRATAGVVCGCVVFALPFSPRSVGIGLELVVSVLAVASEAALGSQG